MSRITGEKEVYERVKDYMVSQNRPYNNGSVFLNLRQEISKTQITKTLTQLTQEGVIEEKVYGKQKIYSAVQPETQTDPEELKNLDRKAKALEAEAGNLQATCNVAKKRLSSLRAAPTTAEAQAEVSRLKESNVASEQKLVELTANAGAVSTEDREKIEKEYASKVGEWRKRKRMVKNFVDTVLENYPKSKKALYDDIGVETDEAAGIDIATF